jgi:hypothetical protein
MCVYKTYPMSIVWLKRMNKLNWNEEKIKFLMSPLHEKRSIVVLQLKWLIPILFEKCIFTFQYSYFYFFTLQTIKCIFPPLQSTVIKLNVGGKKLYKLIWYTVFTIYLHFINDIKYSVFTAFRLSWLFSNDSDPVYWSIMPCGNKQFCQCFRGNCCSHRLCDISGGKKGGRACTQLCTLSPPIHIKHNFSAWLTLLPWRGRQQVLP